MKRRNLSKGQTAIAADEACHFTPEGTRDDARAKKLARIFGVNHTYVSQARALVERDPQQAEADTRNPARRTQTPNSPQNPQPQSLLR